MFTPPPSPLPIPVAGDMSPPPPTLTLSTPEKESGYPFPNMSASAVDPKSPASVEAGRERMTKVLKRKKSGRQILLAVALLPAVLILSATLRHFSPCLRSHLTVEHSSSTLIAKREAQLSTDPDAPDGEAIGQGVVNAGLTPSVTVVSGDVPAIPSNPALPTPFPQPFDTLSANFSTAGCQAFFQNFTQDENFRQCRSFSFLLSASASFLTAQRNLTLINNIIYGTCNTRPTLETCDSRMSTYLSQLGDVCAIEISNQNPTVLQAQVAFQSYTAMRSAACLEDVSSQRYCYVEAVAANDPQDIYYWALPLGTGIPDGVNPTCGACVQSVLAVYSQYVDSGSKTGPSALPSGGQTSGNSTMVSITPSPLPALSKSYPQAARLAVEQCGGTFANVGIADNGASQMAPFLGATLSIGLLLSCWVSLLL